MQARRKDVVSRQGLTGSSVTESSDAVMSSTEMLGIHQRGDLGLLLIVNAGRRHFSKGKSEAAASIVYIIHTTLLNAVSFCFLYTVKLSDA